MVRIKTTTTKGKEFLSPFVYTRIEAEKLLSRIMSWHSHPKYELVPVNGYPKSARPPEDGVWQYGNIAKAEYSWTRYNYSKKQEEEETVDN